MPRKQRGNKRGGRRNMTTTNVDRILMNSIKATGSNTTTVSTDLVDRRQNMNIVQTPPKQIGNQIYWLKELSTYTFNTSTSTFTESNLSFTLSNLADASLVAGVFDQYCIYSVATSISVDGMSPTGVSATVLTALDYDNVANIGPTGISSYSNCSSALIGPSSSIVRYVKPCIALAAYTGTFTGYATQRSWLNCSSASINHYGQRIVVLQTNAVFAVRVVSEIVVGLRNHY